MNEMTIQKSETQVDAQTNQFMNPTRWNMMSMMAETFISSNALPASIKNAPQLMMVMQAGYEAHMQPLEAINSFYFVNGKLSMYGDAVIAQVVKAGHKVQWGKCDGESATVTIVRGDNGQSMEGTFTMKMAESRGLTKNPVYRTSPENMLKFKAFHSIAKFIVPDATRGLPMKEVIEAEESVNDDLKRPRPMKQAEASRPEPAREAITIPARVQEERGEAIPESEGGAETSPENERPTEDQAKEYMEILSDNPDKAEAIEKWIVTSSEGKGFYRLAPSEAKRYLTAAKKKISMQKNAEKKEEDAVTLPSEWMAIVNSVESADHADAMVTALEALGANGAQIAFAVERVQKLFGKSA